MLGWGARAQVIEKGGVSWEGDGGVEGEEEEM